MRTPTLEVVDQLGEELLLKILRKNVRKKREMEEDKQTLEHAKARKLEQPSTDSKHLRLMISKFRIVNSSLNFAVKNRVEVDLYAIMIVMEEMKKRRRRE